MNIKIIWKELIQLGIRFLAFISTEPTSTIIAGVIVFVACEWIKEIWLSPLQEYKKLKAKTSQMLIQYAHFYSNPITIINGKGTNENYDKASEEIRSLASELSAFTEIMPFIHIGIPGAKHVAEASKNLIGISNSFYTTNVDGIHTRIDHAHKYRDAVKQHLKLRGIPK